MTDDERAIRNLIDTWMFATQNGDVETVLNDVNLVA
jgi:ketosteroid isomerase-like protein